MQLVLLGAPGAGKGTQAKIISKRYGIPQISTGNILRDAVRMGTNLGLKAKTYMDSGRLVPDEVVIGLVEERLEAEDCKKGFILDGFPRSIKQAEALEKTLKRIGCTLDAVFFFDLEEEELVKRLNGRRNCVQCQATYNIHFNPPKKEGVCDNCGNILALRDDDREDVVRRRLATYRNETGPVIDYYRRRGRLITVKATGIINEIAESIEGLIREKVRS